MAWSAHARPGRGRFIIVLGVLALAVLLVVVGTSLARAGMQNRYDTGPDAKLACQDVVHSKLGSPSWAKYHSHAKGGGTWNVTGQVELKNAADTRMRFRYRCTVRTDDDGADGTVVSLERRS